MDEGSTGGGAAAGEEKPPAQGFASRLSALYENLLKKKDKTAVPVDEEAPKVNFRLLFTCWKINENVKLQDKDSKEKEGDGEGKEPEKKGDDIVYAELDLARSATESQRPEVVRSDDKTEYAEIVGVVGKGDSSPKKSPEGSPKK